MEQFSSFLLSYVESGGLFAPLFFITFHLIRPFLFLPVVFIYISGGIFFGALAGTFYSVIGITLSSILFYFIIRWMPKTFQLLPALQKKTRMNQMSLTPSQITLLKLVPFIHFHFLSFCLIEITANFKDYTRLSLFSSIPAVFVYTTIGKSIASLSPLYISIFLIGLLFCIYLLRKREINIKWHDFFQVST